MKEAPKISVVTPTLNCGQFIRDCIESVLAQNYENFEHIIVDGGSADGTVDVLREYPHLTWVSEPDDGEVFALNKALKMASGDIIGWLNADDWYRDGVFEKVSEAMNRVGGLHAVYGDTTFVDEIRNERFIKETARDMTLGGVFMRCWHDKQPRQPSIFYSRQLMDDIGLYNDKLHYSIDLEYWLRVVVRYKFHFIDKVFSCARLRGDSKAEGNQVEQIAHHWKISLPYMDYLSEKERVEVWEDYYLYQFFYGINGVYSEVPMIPRDGIALRGAVSALKKVKHLKKGFLYLYGIVDERLENTGATVKSADSAALIKNFKEMFELLAGTREINEAFDQLSEEAKSRVY